MGVTRVHQQCRLSGPAQACWIQTCILTRSQGIRMMFQKHSIRSLAFLLQAMGATDSGRVR